MSQGTGKMVWRSPNHPDFEIEAESAQAVADPAGPPPPPAMGYGLGDWVYRWAHPIGCRVDKWTARVGGRLAWARTHLCGCLACSLRRQKWNAWLPDLRRWKGGWQVACRRVAEAVQRWFLALIDRLF